MGNELQLSAPISERIRELNIIPVNGKRSFVLYWMHHAVRAHENPALDAAIASGNALGVPVLVYQGLGGNHRYNSDRHHTFIMEGARDVQQALQHRGIAYSFYFKPDPSQPTPLRSLADRAALVIVEDFPAPPFPRWNQRLAESVNTPVWAVDSACLVPMQSLSRSYDRAFQFRRRISDEISRRIPEVWADEMPELSPFEGDLGFEPVDMVQVNIASLCAQCDIDHSIGPVGRSPGGSSAGYARWQTFKARGLKSYAKYRNDAAIVPPLGVSRLSPYLHHGHVSPFRIAREAAEIGGSGADKFLDELLVWRELAYNFCFFHEHLETLQAIPDWACSTLISHVKDQREALYTWEQLARGATGDPLWDAAQKSLLIHGELHNNVRMTWGKALLSWTKNPEEALRLLIDLNHRYALDGNDPNSYGGLLWCLGQFDRPFTPEISILGTVRPRSTRQHARRLDLKSFSKYFNTRAEKRRIAIVGAGIAGLCAARTLQDQGYEVRVFDKAGRPGGRTATRYSDDYVFDHGAQYFTVKDERFRRYVMSWVEAGIVQPWRGRIGTVARGKITLKKNDTERYVGVPGMRDMAHHLGQAVEIQFKTRVCAINREGKRWRLRDDSTRDLGDYDAVLVTVPPKQAIPLLKATSMVTKRVAAVRIAPCWAVMVAFEASLDIPVDGAFVQDMPLSWIARNSSKPGRPEHEAWVLHGSPEWSAVNLEMDAEEVADVLLGCFFQVTGITPSHSLFTQAHRWRFALAENPLTEGCLWDEELAIGACGDWCYGSRVEGAFLSGTAGAGRVLSSIS